MIFTAIRDGVVAELSPQFRYRCILEAHESCTIFLVADWEDEGFNRLDGSGRPGRQIGIVGFDPDGILIRCHRPPRFQRLEYYNPNLMDRLVIEIADCVARTREYDDRTRQWVQGALG